MHIFLHKKNIIKNLYFIKKIDCISDRQCLCRYGCLSILTQQARNNFTKQLIAIPNLYLFRSFMGGSSINAYITKNQTAYRQKLINVFPTPLIQIQNYWL